MFHAVKITRIISCLMLVLCSVTTAVQPAPSALLSTGVFHITESIMASDSQIPPFTRPPIPSPTTLQALRLLYSILLSRVKTLAVISARV